MKLYRILILSMIITFISCNAQNEKNNSKIIELNKQYSFFYQFEEVDLSELDKRVEVTGDKNFETLKESISNKALEAKAISFFNDNFNSAEIEALYNKAKVLGGIDQDYAIDIETPEKKVPELSPTLKEKKEALFQRFSEKADSIFQEFKQRVYVLDSINYSSLKNDKSRIEKANYEMHTENGIYKALSFESNHQDFDAFMKSIKISENPDVSFKTIKEVSIIPSQGSYLDYYITLKFNNEGTEQLSVLTEANIGNPLPIIVGNKIITAPYVRNAISDGELQISGNIDYIEARTIADNIREELK